MSKRVIYIAFWNTEVLDLIAFLKEKDGDTELINKLEYLVTEHVSV